MNTEILYVLTNQAFIDDLVKIGWTSRSDLNIRLKELHTTGVPLPFECLRAVECTDTDTKKVEGYIHSIFDKYRLSPKREFFEIDEDKINSMMDLLVEMGARDISAEISGKVDEGSTQAEKNISSAIRTNKENRRSKISFEEYGIPPGSTLVFKRDENITVTTVDCMDKKVILDGNEISLNKATKRLKNKVLGTPIDQDVQAPIEWLYEGNLLDKIRKEMEGL